MSSRNLNDLKPEIRPLVDAFLTSCSEAMIDVLVTCTLRTNAEQATLYAQGRTAPGHIVTNAPAGRSAHNFGLAIDVVPMVNGKPDWKESDPVWKTLGNLGVAAGLQWAGSAGFPFPEEPHFQHPNWRTIAGVA